jgi:hypothetical protein
MIDKRYVELINKELDGFNTESESKELEQFLSENDEALKYYDELLRAASALKRVEQVEPPSFLKTHILNSVKSLPVPVRSGFGWMNSVLELFRRRPSVRYGLVFASGLCVGILLLVIANPWRHDGMPPASKVSGAMVSRPDISQLQVIDSVALDGSGFQSLFKTLRGDGTMTVECVVAAGENLQLELNADPDELKFVGINRLGGTDNDVTATAGKVVFTGTKSEHDLITFTNVASPRLPIEVRLYKGGTVIGSVLVRTN